MDNEETTEGAVVEPVVDKERERWATRRTAIRWTATTVMFVSFFGFLTALSYILATHPPR